MFDNRGHRDVPLWSKTRPLVLLAATYMERAIEEFPIALRIRRQVENIRLRKVRGEQRTPQGITLVVPTSYWR